ncbi:MAG: hypothetical protein HLUCCX14_11305 [Marinobacter excellens HL-55]|uniref:Uncharacterized protein n=1 Tax=Marinobacter excellens HL-55 TaxID=1305731 RepID=A0A0P8CXT5_9GAMM|nr:MAG: hypothetical protein HLUCCX14_11305 [Marinobacter excellens HL-55]
MVVVGYGRFRYRDKLRLRTGKSSRAEVLGLFLYAVEVDEHSVNVIDGMLETDESSVDFSQFECTHVFVNEV